MTGILLLDVILWYVQIALLYPFLITLICILLTFVLPPANTIRFVASYIVYMVWTCISCLMIWPFFLLHGKDIRNCLYGATLLKPMATVLRIKYELKNGHYINADTGAGVVVANHQSFFDVLGMFTKWHVMERCTVIARKKVFWLWPFGLVAWLAGVVFIDRIPSCNKTFQKVNEAADYIYKEKAKLWIFVEGTRNPNPRKLMAFKKGAFRVAISRQLPIIPVVYSPYYFINKKKWYFGTGDLPLNAPVQGIYSIFYVSYSLYILNMGLHGASERIRYIRRITMEALEPISTKGLSLDDMDDLMEKTYRVMSEKNDEFWRQLQT